MVQLVYKYFYKGVFNMKAKKLAAAISAISILISSSAFASFSDMPSGIRGTAMQAAADNGLLNGYPTENGYEIRPDNNITRAEMGAILVRATGASKTANLSGFTDMTDASAWYYSEMGKAVAMGAFKGDDENRLNPNNNITFQEAFVVLSRIFDLSDKKTTDEIKSLKAWTAGTVIDEVVSMVNDNPTPADPFAGYADADLVADWAKEDYGNLLKFGYWQPEDGLLRPAEYITRAEFAMVMHNLVQTYIDEDDVTPATITVTADATEQTKTVNLINSEIHGNTVIRVSDALLKNVDNVSGDIYIADGASGSVYFDNCKISRAVSKYCDMHFFDGYAIELRILDAEKSLYLPAPPINNICAVDAKHISFASKTF